MPKNTSYTLKLHLGNLSNGSNLYQTIQMTQSLTKVLLSLSFSFYFLISLHILHNMQELLTTGHLFPICFQETLPFTKLWAHVLEIPKSNLTRNNIETHQCLYHGDKDNSAMVQTELFNTRTSLPAQKSPLRQCVEGERYGLGCSQQEQSRSQVPPVSSCRGNWQQGEVCFLTLWLSCWPPCRKAKTAIGPSVCLAGSVPGREEKSPHTVHKFIKYLSRS